MPYKRMTDGKRSIPEASINAARENRALCRWVNGKAGINAAVTVLTDAGLLLPLVDGRRYIITCLYINLDTASDTLAVEFVATENDDGSGAVTALSPQFHVATGAAADGRQPQLTAINPPIMVVRGDGYHALTFRAQTNDAGAEATLGFTGFYETED